MTRHLILLIFFIFFLGLTARGQGSMSQAVRAFALDKDLAGAVVAIDVVDVSTGQRLAAHQPDLALIPASTQKLITTAVAMDVLGPNHTFRTRLLARGTLEEGVLTGDIIIEGGGDPTLGSPYQEGVLKLSALLDRWVDKIRIAGITEIRGRIIGDGSYFGTDGTAPGWPWADLGNYYGAGAYGLNVHENFYFLDLLQRSKVGDRPGIQRLRPDVPGLSLSNELRSGPRGSGDQAYIYGAPYGYDNYVRGTIPVGTGTFTIKGAIPDPPLFLAQLLREALAAEGIAVRLPAATTRQLGADDRSSVKVLDEHHSPKLSSLVDRTNLRSNNLYAEALLRAVNKERGRELALLASPEYYLEWLEERGLPTKGLQFEDGSGLATRNFFSPEFMTAFLRSQAGQSRWRQSIPLAGKTGSMRSYLKGTAADGRLWAKSGSLGAVRAYAGYIRSAKGRELAFCIMVNNHTMEGRPLRNKMLALMKELCQLAP
jgi:D-alanyl-D-alanine carboxypeptidase/D-alanyl-D-alanine-endopeptidase (penicillin-binding protein 4)